jgi:hypothetical protein
VFIPLPLDEEDVPVEPTVEPSVELTGEPTVKLTGEPTVELTGEPTVELTAPNQISTQILQKPEIDFRDDISDLNNLDNFEDLEDSEDIELPLNSVKDFAVKFIPKFIKGTKKFFSEFNSKNFLKKKNIIAVSTAVVVIVAGAICWNLFLPKNFIKISGTFYCNTGDGYIAVFPDGEDKPIELQGNLVDYMTDLEQTCGAVLVDDSDFYESESESAEGYSLYFIDKKDKFIDDGVLDFAVSVNGKGVVYLANYDPEKDVADLYLYNGKESKLITDDYNHFPFYTTADYYHEYYDIKAQNSELAGFAISPNGKTVLYTEKDGNDIVCKYTYKNKTYTVGEVTPVGIADKGKYVYYYDDQTFYVQKKDKPDTAEKISEVDEDDFSENNSFFKDEICFNFDMTQVISTTNEKGSYLSNKGNERVKASKERLYVIGTEQMAYMQFENSNIAGVRDFKKTIAMGVNDDFEFSLHKIGSNFEAERLAKDIGNIGIAENGKDVYYINNDGDLCRMNVAKNNPEEEKIVDERDLGSTLEILNTPDLKYIYYENDDNELVMLKGNKQEIIDDIDNFKVFTVFDDKVYAITTDNELVYFDKDKVKYVKFDGEVDYFGDGNNKNLIFDVIDDSKIDYDQAYDELYANYESAYDRNYYDNFDEWFEDNYGYDDWKEYVKSVQSGTTTKYRSLDGKHFYPIETTNNWVGEASFTNEGYMTINN